jgi:tRNA G18 (ribose-2'-O)-methylase SpoU
VLTGALIGLACTVAAAGSLGANTYELVENGLFTCVTNVNFNLETVNDLVADVQAEKLAIVLGAEGDGLAADTIARCDHTVLIPMSNGVDSLNVAAASAVAGRIVSPENMEEVR